MSPIRYPQQVPESPWASMPEELGLKGGRINLDDLRGLIDVLIGMGAEVEIRVGEGTAGSVDDLEDASDDELRRVRLAAVRDQDAHGPMAGDDDAVDVEGNLRFDPRTGLKRPILTVDLGKGRVQAHTLPARGHLKAIVDRLASTTRRSWGRRLGSGWTSAIALSACALATALGLTNLLFVTGEAVAPPGGGQATGFEGWSEGARNTTGVAVLAIALMLVFGMLRAAASESRLLGSPVRVDPVSRRQDRANSRSTRRELVVGVTGAAVGAVLGASLTLGATFLGEDDSQDRPATAPSDVTTQR